MILDSLFLKLFIPNPSTACTCMSFKVYILFPFTLWRVTVTVIYYWKPHLLPFCLHILKIIAYVQWEQISHLITREFKDFPLTCMPPTLLCVALLCNLFSSIMGNTTLQAFNWNTGNAFKMVSFCFVIFYYKISSAKVFIMKSNYRANLFFTRKLLLFSKSWSQIIF